MPRGVYDRVKRRKSKYPLRKRVVCKKCFNVFYPDIEAKRASVECDYCGKLMDIRDRTEYTRKYADSHPERLIKAIAYDKKHGKERRLKERTQVRKVVFNIISDNNAICSNCGCDDMRLLEINHKNGGGNKELQKGKYTNAFLWNIYMGRRKVNDLNLLCRVCNALHYHECKYGKLPYVISWGQNV